MDGWWIGEWTDGLVIDWSVGGKVDGWCSCPTKDI